MASAAAQQAQFALALLVALAQRASASVHMDNSGGRLTLQLTVDKAALPEEVRQALRLARHQLVRLDDDDDKVGVEVRIAPLSQSKRKTGKPKATRKAVKRKRGQK